MHTDLLALSSLLSLKLTKRLQARLTNEITFQFTIGLASSMPDLSACPMGSLLYLWLTTHLQAWLAPQITFQFTIRFASSMPVCTQTFWVASGLRLTALPLAHHMHMQAWLTYRSPFSSPSGSPQAYQCAHRPFGLPLCSLLSPWLTMHLHTWLSHQITFRFTIRLASCQCAHRPFGLPLGSLLYSKLQASASSAHPPDHLLVHHWASLKHASVHTDLLACLRAL